MAEQGRKETPAWPEGEIQARIIDAENGLRLLSNVYGVRVRSRGYNLLIMDDYLPALGEIDGDIVFLTEEGERRLENIKGFYKHQHNEFTLLIESLGGPAEEKEARP